MIGWVKFRSRYGGYMAIRVSSIVRFKSGHISTEQRDFEVIESFDEIEKAIVEASRIY